MSASPCDGYLVASTEWLFGQQTFFVYDATTKALVGVQIYDGAQAPPSLTCSNGPSEPGSCSLVSCPLAGP